MLRINRRTDYAIRVMLALAKRPEGSRVFTGEVAAQLLGHAQRLGIFSGGIECDHRVCPAEEVPAVQHGRLLKQKHASST